MRLKASIDYSLRAVLYLAVRGVTCSSKEIAEHMSIPRDYLIQLAQLLRRGGIIAAHPGKNGGYSLAKDPSEITLLQVFNAIDDETSFSPTVHERHAQSSQDPVDEAVRNAYERASGLYEDFFAETTIASLIV